MFNLTSTIPHLCEPGQAGEMLVMLWFGHQDLLSAASWHSLTYFQCFKSHGFAQLQSRHKSTWDFVGTWICTVRVRCHSHLVLTSQPFGWWPQSVLLQVFGHQPGLLSFSIIQWFSFVMGIYSGKQKLHVYTGDGIECSLFKVGI